MGDNAPDEGTVAGTVIPDDTPKQLGIIASYNVTLTLRGDNPDIAPTIDELERMISDSLVIGIEGGRYLGVRANATRTDK